MDLDASAGTARYRRRWYAARYLPVAALGAIAAAPVATPVALCLMVVVPGQSG